jgi:hypothetical protein
MNTDSGRRRKNRRRPFFKRARIENRALPVPNPSRYGDFANIFRPTCGAGLQLQSQTNISKSSHKRRRRQGACIPYSRDSGTMGFVIA